VIAIAPIPANAWSPEFSISLVSQLALPLRKLVVPNLDSELDGDRERAFLEVARAGDGNASAPLFGS
jgi:hypothetical protein